MVSVSTPLVNEPTHFSSHSKAIANYKRTNLRKLLTSDISDVATASVHSEKTCMKKLIMIIYYYEQIASKDGF